MAAARVTVFSDFTCPFSYVTEVGLRRAAAGGEVEVLYRAYELHPSPFTPPSTRPAEWREALRPLLDALDLPLGPPPIAPRTRKAHEAARFARRHQAEMELRDAIFAAYWAEARDIGRVDELTALAAGVGLDPGEMRIALDIDALADEVLADRLAAERMGVRHTPTLIFGSGDAAGVRIGALSLPEIESLLAGDR